MLVLDIDGTLTNSKKEITPATRQALYRYHNFILSFNGAKITDCGSGETVYEQVLPKTVIPEIYRAAIGYGAGLISYEGDDVIAATPIDPYMELEAHINGLLIRRVPDFADYITFPVNKCLMTGAPEYLAELERRMQKQFGERLSIYRSEPYFLEFMPPNVDKAKSLEKLLEKLSLTREETVCCGDGFNDISMIEYAGLGVAMANAQPPVQERADYVTASNDEDGIIKVIEKFF